MTQHFFHEVFFFFIVFNIVLPTTTFSTTTLSTVISRTIMHHDKIGIIEIFMSLICFPYFSCNVFLVACFYTSHPHDDPKLCSSPWNLFLLSDLIVFESYHTIWLWHSQQGQYISFVYLIKACLLAASIKSFTYLYVGGFMTSFHVHPWPIHMWYLKRKGIFGSR